MEERRDHHAVAGQETGLLGHARRELLDEDAVHRNGQGGLELLAIARELLPVALHEQGAHARGSGIRAGMRSACGHRHEQLLVGEPESPGAIERLLHEDFQASRRAPLARGRALHHEGAAPLLAFEIAVLEETRQRVRGGVAVDPQEARELPHRGQLHARLEMPGLDQVPDLRRELHVHRHAALPVHLEPRRRDYGRRLARHRAWGLDCGAAGLPRGPGCGPREPTAGANQRPAEGDAKAGAPGVGGLDQEIGGGPSPRLRELFVGQVLLNVHVHDDVASIGLMS